MKTQNGVLHCGDAIEILKSIPAGSVHCCVTSPPYFGLRDYGVPGQIGMESSPTEYITALTRVFDEVHRVLNSSGTLWVNIGDSYAANRAYQVPSTKGGAKHSHSQAAGGKGSTVPVGLKPKDLIGVPWMLAFALRARGWYLRQDIIWAKPNAMPESVKDRCTKAHEYLFLLSKSQKYYFDGAAIKEKATGREPGNKKHKHAANTITRAAHGDQLGRTKLGLMNIQATEQRNRRSVWNVATRPYKGAHFAVFPPQLVEPCILAGCPVGGTVIDPFSGSGTTAATAVELGRQYIGIDLSAEYCELAMQRISEAETKVQIAEEYHH